MIKADFLKRDLIFRFPAGTSRGVLLQKPSWFIYLRNKNNPAQRGIGECSVIPGLSPEHTEKTEQKIGQICKSINNGEYDFSKPVKGFPSINFGLETALKDYHALGSKILYPSNFTSGKDGILINGLIWMGDSRTMLNQVQQKLKDGFRCIKLKIGAINFDDELKILKCIRNEYRPEDVEIRVDANGAFRFEKAREVLDRLAELNVHSIEQPIPPSNAEQMAELCKTAPVPIALDEELIKTRTTEEKRNLIETIKPQYLILKPSLLGGFQEAGEWIKIAESNAAGWWVTSALESNIGLNAIAQWTFTLKTTIPQGLGTGGLFKNNIESPLEINAEKLFYNSSKNWDNEFVY